MEDKNEARKKFNLAMRCIQARLHEEQEKRKTLAILRVQGLDKESLTLSERWINAFLANGLTVSQAMNVLRTLNRLREQEAKEEKEKKP